jgi:hypothetical protein
MDLHERALTGDKPSSGSKEHALATLKMDETMQKVRSLDEVLVPRVRSVQLLRVMDPHERIRFSVAKQSRDEAMRHVFDGRHLCVCVCVCRWVAKQSRDEAMRHVFDGRHLCGQTEHVWPDRACVANRACVSVCVGVWPNRAGMKQ